MRILVTGGAGYVGSFAVRHLMREGHEVRVIDNLCQGHRETLPPEVLVVGDIADRELVGQLLDEHRAEAVMHFAAATSVAESVQNPAYHYRNNTAATLGLLETMLEHGVRKFVFSSTAATYGEAAQSDQSDQSDQTDRADRGDGSDETPLHEDAPKNPVCAYGFSKLATEWIIRDFSAAYGLSYAVLRYFNAAGAAPDGSHGEDHDPETHLIPLIVQAVQGKRDAISLFGSDYDTPDGTAVRDYVHVEDLALAHQLALEACPEPDAPERGDVFNVGTGGGNSVLEVVGAVERVTGEKVPYQMAPRRAGDPARLVASSERLRTKLGWRPRYEDIEQVVAHAWAWHRSHPEGYRSV